MSQTQILSQCGCCEGLTCQTSVQIYNRPGLTAIAYRAGEFDVVKKSLLSALSRSDLPGLKNLTTRSTDDFSIALLDAWAAVSEVFTFYQERIANESYLGTATEQISVLQLARLIGYELRPGVAASTFLAFTIEEGSMTRGQIAVSGNSRSIGDPTPSFIPTGTKVQSIPDADETPQTFETIEDIEARAEWNAIKPVIAHKMSSFSNSAVIMVIKGTGNDLKPGDLLLLIQNSSQPTLKKIIKVEFDQDAGTTAVYFDQNAQYEKTEDTPDEKNISFRAIGDYAEKKELNASVLADLMTGTWHEEDFSTILNIQGWSQQVIKTGFAKNLSNQATAGIQVFVFRKKTALFGYNAPKYTDYYKDDFTLWDPPRTFLEWPIITGNSVYLDSPYDQVVKGGYIALQKPGEEGQTYQIKEAQILPFTAYGISAKSTVISTVENSALWGASDDLGTLRSIAAYVQSEPLQLADSPVVEPVKGDTIVLGGLYLGLIKGATVIVYGERDESDLSGTHAAELRKIKKIYVQKGLTTIVLDKDLQYTYIRKSLTINANVAPATHGETVKEVLGTGDPAQSFQKFILKQPPLTFTGAATPGGAKSTLEIRVNDLLWREVPSLYERGPNEHVFITRQNDQAQTTVIFGDGKNGARLPSGQENIRAVYRKGIGSKGLLKADQLSQLISRPLGAKAVSNPGISSGAQDRELLADARKNATLTIFTLDRIVSLQDYEDYARAFAGISKALATWSWKNHRQVVYLTVAGFQGATIDSGSDLYINLLTSINQAGIPGVPVVLDSYSPVFFRITANLIVNPDYLPDQVKSSVTAKLCEYFSFEQRTFGQSIAFSEVIAVIQDVEGVIAADIDELYRTDGTLGAKETILYANPPVPGDNKMNKAELLTTHPNLIELKLIR